MGHKNEIKEKKLLRSRRVLRIRRSALVAWRTSFSVSGRHLGLLFFFQPDGALCNMPALMACYKLGWHSVRCAREGAGW